MVPVFDFGQSRDNQRLRTLHPGYCLSPFASPPVVLKSRRAGSGEEQGALWNLDGVGAAFAEAAIDPTRWNPAMEVAAETAGGIGAVMIPIRGRLDLPRSPSTASSFEAAYTRDGWVHR